MSHELKTPLANIREGAELLMDGAVGPLDNSQREVVAILRDNGIKLHRLIENLLSFSAWQKESVGLDLTEFRLRPLVKQVLESQQLTVVSQRVRLEVKVDDLTLRADRGKTAPHHREPAVQCHQILAQGRHRLSTCRQTGHPARDRRRRRRRRHSVGGARARVRGLLHRPRRRAGVQVKGTGIGLSVVLEFVNAHGGTIEIVDGEYPGAHFRIRMPVLSVTNPARTHGACGISSPASLALACCRAGRWRGCGAVPISDRASAGAAVPWTAIPPKPP